MNQDVSREAIFAFLRDEGIPHCAFSHPKADDLPTKLKNDADHGVFGATHCKNLVLANRQKTKFYLLTMPLEKRFRTGPTSRQMGSGRLNFAEDEVLEKLLHTVPGMVSPLELIFDGEHVLSYYMDEDLKEADQLCFHPGDDTYTVVLEKDVFFRRVLPAMGVSVAFVSIPDEE
jgi:Ala-tRNA(Pro) deacylase